MAVVTVVGSALFIYGYDRVVRELDDFAAMSVDELDKRSARRNLWLANGKSISGSPWVGRGVGSHREFYKIFMPNPFPLEYTHAESGYWQVASETGIAGFILLAAGLGLVASWSVSCMRNTTCRHTQAALGAVAAGLAASVVHAVWDFVWYIPATMSWTALLAGMACRLQQIPRARRASWGCDIRLARVGWVAITVLLAIVGAWMIRDRWSPALASRHWDNYLKKSQLSAEAGDRSAEDTLGDGTSEHAAAETWTAQMRADLETYLEYDRDYGRVHLRLAATYLREFHDAQRHATNPMDLSQIRDAAIASQFPSRAALNQWLDRAIGQHRMLLDKALWHARRALQLCPLQGEGYIYLAELCFLEGAPRSATSAYVAQALKVRPHEGQVLFLAGKEALLKSDLKSAVGYWRQSFHAGASHQRRLVRLLAGRLPVTFLLENIQPGLDAWESLFAEYERLGQPQPLRQLCDYYVALAEKKREGLTGTRAVRLWLTMHRRYRELNEQEAAYACIERAVASDPYNYLARLELAKAELQRGNLRDAETQFRWCLQQRPADRKAKSWLKKAVRLRVATSHWPDDSASDSRISDRH
ncbi:MAG: hypothetical protein GTO62_03080 [Planctomycetales bacterium]|nr:hypothetical protein [Planctomycetales bacterium]NIP68199.1 hypothetical protein [Planctomycetales bacterium]